MKALLIGLLALGSISAIAAPKKYICKLDIKDNQTSELFYTRTIEQIKNTATGLVDPPGDATPFIILEDLENKTGIVLSFEVYYSKSLFKTEAFSNVVVYRRVVKDINLRRDGISHNFGIVKDTKLADLHAEKSSSSEVKTEDYVFELKCNFEKI